MDNHPALCIGLFGTCGDSTWRDKFIDAYQKLGFVYYNPNKVDWDPADSAEEAEHLRNDGVILFPIFGETFGTASLAETGYSILSALRTPGKRMVIILIDPKVSAALVAKNPQAAKESNNARAIVLAHLAQLDYPYVHVVETEAQLLKESIRAYRSLKKQLGA